MKLILLLILCSWSCVGQDLAAVRKLEHARGTDVAAWRALLAAPDAALHAAALTGLGRVGDARLFPLLLDELVALAPDAAAELRAAGTLAVALNAERKLLPELARSVGGAALAFAAGGCGALPEGPGREVVLAALRSNEHAVRLPGGVSDPVEARLLYGGRYGDPDLAELARGVFAAATAAESAEDAPHPQRLHAALFSLQRAKTRPAAEWRASVAPLLLHADSRVAGRAARVLALLADADVRDAAVLVAAEETGGARSARIERLRAIGNLTLAPARGVLLKALASGDVALERTAFEALAAGAASLAREDRGAFALRAKAAADADSRREVQRASVLALAALDPAGFPGMARQWRLARPWTVRASAGAAFARLLPQQGAHFCVLEALRDCDPRVQAATLEAAADRFTAANAEARELMHLLQPPPTYSLGAPVPVPWAEDPVALAQWGRILSAWVKVAAKTPENREWVSRFIQQALGRIKYYDVECRQSLVELAIAADCHGELERFAESSEPSIRQPALAALHREADPTHFRMRCVPARAGELPREATLHTSRGDIVLELFADEAPATVLNFTTLVEQGFYDGMPFHRRVPGFVAQAGCPRGDGWGGPEYTIPCELNARSYRRGSLGMALAGKDTGGSQWFLTLEDAPHLDGRYTLFGNVKSGHDVMDALTEDDLIVNISFTSTAR